MGMKANLEAIWLAKRTKTWRPPALYAVADTPFDLFTIAGGPIKIHALTCYLEEAITTAVTWHFLCGAVLLDAALFAAIGNPDETVAVPLDIGAALIPPAEGSPSPSILAAAFNVEGIVVAPDVITMALGGAADIDGLTSFCLEWSRLSPAVSVVPSP